MNGALESLAVWLLDFDLLAMLLIAAALAALAAVRQPAQRLAVTKSTLVALLLLAALCALPGWSVVHLLTNRPPRANGSPVRSLVQNTADHVTKPSNHRMQPLADNSEHFALPPIDPASPATVNETPSTPTIAWTSALVGVHAIGALGIAAWLAIGSIAAHRLRRSSGPAPATLITLLREVAGGSFRSTLVPLHISDRIDVAVALGVWRPIVLLPAKWIAGRSTEELRAVLAHECAHVRGHDLRWLAVSRVLLVLLWVQPHYWLLRRRLRLDQEALADTAAADVSTRHVYAEQLVAWARDVAIRRRVHLSSAVGLWEGPSQLRQRIALLVDDRLTILRDSSPKWRAATLMLCALLAVGLSLLTLEPRRQSLADEAQKPADADLKKPENENPPQLLRLRVIDESGAPIAGATVRPNGLRAEGDGSHYGWFADMEGRGAPAAATTDDEGVARVRYPSYIEERRRTHIVTLRLAHPAFVAKGEEVPVAAEETKITMSRGGVLEIEGVVASAESPVENLHAVDQNLETTWTRLAGGAIQSPPLAAGRADVRVVWFPDGKPTHFSRVAHLDLREGEKKQLRLELLPGTRLVGEIAMNVPRPVTNGKVVARVDSPGETDWMDWTPINEDGSFEFESLPRDQGEIVQLIAICDGYASKPPPSADNDPPYGMPQTASLGKDTAHHVMEMIPTAKCVIELRDPNDQPVVGARVSFNPNVRWQSGGSSIFAHPLYRSKDLVFGKGTWFLTPDQWRKEYPYQALSDEDGTVHLMNMPPFAPFTFGVEHDEFELPIVDDGRQARTSEVKLNPGLISVAAVTLQPKGTEFIGENDSDAGRSTENGTAAPVAPDELAGAAVENVEAAPPQADDQAATGATSTAATTAPSLPTRQPHVELTFIIAQHVILHDGKIIEWADIERMLNEHADPTQAHPTFEFTRGAIPTREEEIREKIWTLRKDVQLAGHSWSSVLPRASARYDAIRTAADLVANEAWRVEGVVETVDGKTIAGAEVVLCPPVDDALPYKTLDIYLREFQLREPVDEIVTHTSADGRFAAYPTPGEPYYLVALAREGFGLVRSDEFTETKRIETRPWARIQGRVKSDIRFEQSADITVRVPESGRWPELSFHQYTVDLESPAPNGEFEFAYVPPALQGFLSRSIKNPDGGSFGLPYREFKLRPGETLTVEIDPPAEKDLKQLEDLQRDTAGRREGQR